MSKEIRDTIFIGKKPLTTYVGYIKINSESLVSTDGRNRDVSTIEITLKRQQDRVV